VLDRYENHVWIFRVRIPFTHLLPLIHWDLIVGFAVAGAISALYGAFVSSSPKQGAAPETAARTDGSL
jgi:hypothetical protein